MRLCSVGLESVDTQSLTSRSSSSEIDEVKDIEPVIDEPDSNLPARSRIPDNSPVLLQKADHLHPEFSSEQISRNVCRGDDRVRSLAIVRSPVEHRVGRTVLEHLPAPASR